MRHTISIAAAMVLALVTGCKKESNDQSGNGSQDFSAIAESYFQVINELAPLNATFNGQNEYNDKLTLEMTDAYRKQAADSYRDILDRLAKIDIEDLDEEQKISYEIIRYEIDNALKFQQYPTHLTPIEHMQGTHLTMAMFASGESGQPFKTEKDYLDFLKRMETYAVYLDSAKAKMEEGIRKKITLPKAVAKNLVPQFADMASEKAEDNLFYAAIKKMPADIPEQARKDISAKYAAVIDQKLNPRFRQMAAFIRDVYVPACRTTSGVGDLYGKDFYQHCVRVNTTTDMTPEEIHQLGLREVARIRSEMEKVKTQVGFNGTIKEFFDHVRSKKELMPFTKPEQVIENFNKIHERIKPNVDKLFSLQPKTAFEVRRTEAFREKTASAQYYQGLADGSRPGIFYVPIPDVTRYNYYADEDLFLHEAIPGHHFQVMLQQENEKLPKFRKYAWFNAYGEGWALYTESLGKELGLYKDPYQYFGMLSSEMHRAIRLVVDTGLHAKGWTREQAIQYSLDNEAESEASIIAEIERYMVWPGQALGYKIGQIKILELRERAQKKLGSKFDIKKFHEIVLESGVLPLELLEKKVERWTNEK